ncbi:hypothetical protein TRFO_10459 [Tritrichomonas foetus]|uniref:Uncharacterized protein n=1 Tax=Tritrichomonas foetus TaxID=1144522 RepID=A0A1J4JA63_9EUKA|nr:hypothetical protein TRFO_10459 [Tritrichomonas foetus]|eukprot:OHS95561.1 hypothetical protein TRFO_10459 [Tritrichomonas foetus]
MSVLSLFAPTSTDKEYLTKLINDMTPRNADTNCHSIQELLLNSKEITRKDLVPILSKMTTFIEQKSIEKATLIATTLVNNPNRFFKAGDFKQAMTAFISKPELQSSLFTPPFLGLCERSLLSESDIPLLIDDPMDLVPIASLSKDPMVTSFIVRVAQLVPALRVPFTFNGLIEQILPTISSNQSHLSLLASLLSDPQSRQYFCDMGHIPNVVTALFELNISTLATSVFRALLDPNDLLHLSLIQKKLIDMSVPKQLVVSMTMPDSTDETIQNAAVCLADCIKYYKLDQLPFQTNFLFDLINSKPHIQNAFLYLFETISISNPSLFPKDEEVVSHILPQNNPFALLFLSYLSYSCWRKSSLDFTQISSLTGHNLSLALACATQRHYSFPNAEILAQSPENESTRAIACANCLFSHKIEQKGNLQRHFLVHYASQFFNMHGNDRNPIIGGHVNEYFPEAFLVWGRTEFSETNRGRLINETVTYDKSPQLDVFDLPPDQAHVNLLEMNARTRKVMRDNDTWKARYEALEAEHAKLTRDYSRVEMELIESQCQHLVNIESQLNEH